MRSNLQLVNFVFLAVISNIVYFMAYSILSLRFKTREFNSIEKLIILAIGSNNSYTSLNKQQFQGILDESNSSL